MASIINASTSGVGGVITTADNTGILNIQTAGTTAVTVNASQNVGIGTTSPTTKLTVAGVGRYTSGTEGTQIGHNGTIGYIETAGNSSTPITFYNGGTEKMRIDSSGQILFGGVTALGDTKVNARGNNVFYAEIVQSAGGGYQSKYTAGSGTAYFGYWQYGATLVGTITSTGSTTAYNTSSDYRLKENIAPMVNALDKVALLKPVTYTWKASQENDEGFIAHELAEVMPQAVTGDKDAVDAEGNPVYQGIDTSFLVATLTAAIQELKAIVDTQAQRIAVLEAK